MRIRELKIKVQNHLLLIAASVLFLAGQMLAHAQATAETPASSSSVGNYMAVGTLAYHLSTNTAGYAKGHSGTPDDMEMLSNWHYAEYKGTNFPLLTNVTRSTNFWLNGVKGVTATSIGYSNGMGGQNMLTMVSPRHYLFSTHVHPEGYLTAFLGTNNVIYWRRTLQRIDIANDTSVGILNADLPPSVGFLPVLPPNFADYLPTNAVVIQGIGMNQDQWMFSQPMTFGFPPYIAWSSAKQAPLGPGTNWNKTVRGGDSSNPDMLLIGDQLVLVSHNLSVQAGPDYALQLDAINAAMHQLSIGNRVRSDYQLTTFPLTNWPKLH